MENSPVKHRDANVDLFKYFCAVLVVFLHTANLGKPYPDSFTNILTSLIHKVVWIFNPVEFFFIASSFYFFQKHWQKNTNLRKQSVLYAKRLVQLYAFWSCFYLPKFILSFLSAKSMSDILRELLKFFRAFLFSGTSGHLWYVLSLIYGILFLSLFLDEKGQKTPSNQKLAFAWIFSISMYALALAGESYYYLFSKTHYFTKILDFFRSAFGSMYLLRGPLYVMLGYQLAKTPQKRTHNHSLALWLFLGLANVCELSAIKFLGTGLSYSTTLLKPLAAYFMWIYVKQLPIKESSFTSFLAQASVVTYFFHIFVSNLLSLFLSNYYIIWIADVSLCLLVAYILHQLKQRPSLKWLKYVL